MKQSKGVSLISLAYRAGDVVSGEFCTEQEIRKGRAALVILAGDASENTRKKFSDLCQYREVPLCFYQDKETLGHAMGKEVRASLAIVDAGFAEKIRKEIETEELGDERRR